MASSLSETDQKELQGFLETEQAKARVQSSVHQFTDMCWDKCVTSIGSRLGKEATCLSNCVERFLDSSLYIVRSRHRPRKHTCLH